MRNYIVMTCKDSWLLNRGVQLSVCQFICLFICPHSSWDHGAPWLQCGHLQFYDVEEKRHENLFQRLKDNVTVAGGGHDYTYKVVVTLEAISSELHLSSCVTIGGGGNIHKPPWLLYTQESVLFCLVCICRMFNLGIQQEPGSYQRAGRGRKFNKTLLIEMCTMLSKSTFQYI